MTNKTDIPMTPPAPRRLHLEFLDGLRGLSAFYVLLFHISYNYRDTLPRPARLLTGWMSFGVLAVTVFIVLSGYCLMLPVARSANGELRGGVGNYIKRRARRILPPYYAALFLSIGLAFLLPSNLRVPALSPGNLTMHLLVIHNLRSAYSQSRLNSPMWSVGMEWQIYFLFPLILLPVWRRFGNAAVILTGFTLGLLPHFLLPKAHNFDWTAPPFIGLFAMGMAGAVLTCREGASSRISGAAAGRISLLCAFLMVALFTIEHSVSPFFFITIEDIAVALTTLSFLLYCVRSERKPFLTRVLESRWLVLLGTFSYSLYLTHGPLVLLAYNALLTTKLTATESVCLMLFGVGPLCVVFSYAFHILFERRFLSAPVRAAEEKALHSVGAEG